MHSMSAGFIPDFSKSSEVFLQSAAIQSSGDWLAGALLGVNGGIFRRAFGGYIANFIYKRCF